MKVDAITEDDLALLNNAKKEYPTLLAKRVLKKVLSIGAHIKEEHLKDSLIKCLKFNKTLVNTPKIHHYFCIIDSCTKNSKNNKKFQGWKKIKKFLEHMETSHWDELQYVTVDQTERLWIKTHSFDFENLPKQCINYEGFYRIQDFRTPEDWDPRPEDIICEDNKIVDDPNIYNTNQGNNESYNAKFLKSRIVNFFLHV